MENKRKFKPNPDLELMDQVREVLRYYNYAYRTEQTYCDWIVRFLKFFDYQKHPSLMGKTEIEGFLSHLAGEKKVSAATQRQALNAIVFLYKKVLDTAIEDELEPIRARRKARPPVVMTKNEVQQVLVEIHGTHLLMVQLLYGCGLRLTECIRLRVHNVDFERDLIYIFDAKGGKNRTVNLPKSIDTVLRHQVDRVKHLHDMDLLKGNGSVYLPEALARKYRNTARDFRWQYLFPAKKLSADPRSGSIQRHHVLESGLQKAVKSAVKRAGIVKRVSCHSFRHSFATHLLEDGVNIRIVQELMGHADIKATEIYTHAMEKNIFAVSSPLDSL